MTTPTTDRFSSTAGRNGRRRARLLVAAALLVLVGIAVPGRAAEAARLPDLQCGVNPTTDVRLRQDLVCEGGFKGSSDQATPPVNIDLGGHTLTVTDGTCTYFGACGAFFNEASVVNGTVVGDLKDVVTVRRVHVVGSVYLGENFHHTWLLDRSVVRNGRVAVFGPDVTISNNRISGDGDLGGGIQFLDALVDLRNITIVGNRLVDVGIDIYDTCGGCPGDISGRIAENVLDGGGITIRGQLGSLGLVEITANTIRDSVGDGIHVAPPQFPAPSGGPIVVTGNRFSHVVGHAVNVEWVATDPGSGVVDGGGNVAVRSGASPACVGIVCRER